MTDVDPHIPVLYSEVLLYAKSEKPIHYVLDGTLGYGGHASKILQSHPEIIRYIGLDQDESALELARQKLLSFGKTVETYCTNFSELPEGIPSFFDLILLDIGVSSMQLDTPERGFSFMRDGPLDMRMNQQDSFRHTAEDIVNGYSIQDLQNLFFSFGEEPRSRQIAKAIAEARRKTRFVSTLQLANFIETICPRYGKAHPATRVFQALRIAVNQELDVLEKAVSSLPLRLSVGGRLQIITFHSMEDRIVKQGFQKCVQETKIDKEASYRIVTKKPIEATREEIRMNRRSRSAKLRVLERVI